MGAAAPQHAPSASLAGPQLGSCASSGLACRLWAARYSRDEAGPLGAQPLPRVLELAAFKAAECTAFDPSGADEVRARRAHFASKQQAAHLRPRLAAAPLALALALALTLITQHL